MVRTMRQLSSSTRADLSRRCAVQEDSAKAATGNAQTAGIFCLHCPTHRLGPRLSSLETIKQPQAQLFRWVCPNQLPLQLGQTTEQSSPSAALLLQSCWLGVD